MNQRILILFFFSSILTTSAQSLNLELLKGNWTHTDTGGGVTGEFWKISGQGAIGEGYHIFFANSKEIQEKLYIEKFAGNWCYIAVPNQQKPVMFCADSITSHFWRFVNHEHDFPQVIEYSFLDERTLEINIYSNRPIEKSAKFYLFKTD